MRSARAAAIEAEAEEAPRAADRLSFLIHRVNARIANTANRLFRTTDIESSGARILVLLLERDGQRVGQLVEAMSLPQPTLSHHLARLERRGLIRRWRTAEDNRSVAVGLTSAGHAVAVECEALSAGVHAHMVRDLSGEQVAEMRRMLLLMAETLDAYEGAADASSPPARGQPTAAARGRLDGALAERPQPSRRRREDADG